MDCKLSAWSGWSRCDRTCGKGVQSRSRVIVQHPSPGRPPCEPLEQKRGCMGTSCSRKDRKYKNPIRGTFNTFQASPFHLSRILILLFSETAGLLAARFFEQRYKPSYDVRENLFEHQKSKSKQSYVQDNEIEDGYQSDQPYGGGNQISSLHFETQPDE